MASRKYSVHTLVKTISISIHFILLRWIDVFFSANKSIKLEDYYFSLSSGTSGDERAIGGA